MKRHSGGDLEAGFSRQVRSSSTRPSELSPGGASVPNSSRFGESADCDEIFFDVIDCRSVAESLFLSFIFVVSNFDRSSIVHSGFSTSY